MNISEILNVIKTRTLGGIVKLTVDEREVYYINGADTLPPPLSKEEEERAIGSLCDSDEAKNLLIKHNLRLVVYISKKFDNTGVGLEDLISIGTIGLIKAVNTYNPDKNIKLATYASRCIENEILMYMRKNASHRGDISIDESLNTDWDGNELLLSDVLGTEENSVGENIERNEEERCVREAVSRLDSREREIIELRYGLDGRREMTQKEVADRLGISQSYISRLEKKIIGRLKKQIGQRV
ncbi:MAG: RNA polymerase sporulation sigma factor SigE [Clostridia bacterium]|nr:RNA polymerase sporulation sigma factor SigE [Clostridia bacterium]